MAVALLEHLPTDLIRRIVRLVSVDVDSSTMKGIALRASCATMRALFDEAFDVHAFHPSTAVFFSRLPLDRIVARPVPRDVYMLIHTRMHHRTKNGRFAHSRDLLDKIASDYVQGIRDPTRRDIVTHVLWPCLKSLDEDHRLGKRKSRE